MDQKQHARVREDDGVKRVLYMCKHCFIFILAGCGVFAATITRLLAAAQQTPANHQRRSTVTGHSRLRLVLIILIAI